MLNPETNKNKDKKNTNINFEYLNNLLLVNFCKNNFFDRNLSKADNIIDKTFSNNKNKKKLIPLSKKTK